MNYEDRPNVTNAECLVFFQALGVLSLFVFICNSSCGTGKNRTHRIVIYYRFVGYVEIPEVSHRQHIKADIRKGGAVVYLTDCIIFVNFCNPILIF